MILTLLDDRSIIPFRNCPIEIAAAVINDKWRKPCEKAPFIEKTENYWCTLCGECIDICSFSARSIKDREMLVDRENCYGCSVCEYICPTDAISMIAR